jgi:hypothetical protein
MTGRWEWDRDEESIDVTEVPAKQRGKRLFNRSQKFCLRQRLFQSFSHPGHTNLHQLYDDLDT